MEHPAADWNLADNDTLRELAVASAPWNFSPTHPGVGREVLGRMPYDRTPVEWSAAHFNQVWVDGAGHRHWIEQPLSVRNVVRAFAHRIADR